MRRVLVPLDGTEVSAAILPDAIRLAGTDGEIMLLIDVCRTAQAASDAHPDVSRWNEYADAYLRPHIQEVQSRGVRAATHKLWISDPIPLITDMARHLQADMIACATHGRSPFGRLIHGATAWHVVAHSQVPVLLRHVDPERPVRAWSGRSHIMVPLDGSAYAEKALPLAVELAAERNAALSLVRVATAGLPDWGAANMAGFTAGPIGYQDQITADRCYLDEVAASLPVDTTTYALGGSPIAAALSDFVQEHDISDVVMTTHGRTGLTRVVLGSVADSLVHELTCPIMLVPALAAARTTCLPAQKETSPPIPMEVRQ